jgi:ankyrin repeat protein
VYYTASLPVGLLGYNLGVVAEFVKAALRDLRRAEEMLAEHPELASAGFYAALVLGDVRQVEVALRESPDMATAKGGPMEWEPLVYVCFSRFAIPNPARLADFVGTARLLLNHGADPNTSYMDERWKHNPLPCLYGATGLNNNPALARVLLEAGARTDDSESLYHSTEHPDLVCLRLLLEFGASTQNTNALKHMLDREDLAGLRLLLAAGADPNERNPRGETALHWAVWRGRGTEIIATLLDAGVDIEARRQDGRSAYALAVRSGQTETAKLLDARGASTDLSPVDRFVGSLTGAAPEDLPGLLTKAPLSPLPEECARLLPEFASTHRTDAVRALLAAGIPLDTRGENGGTALHWACWKGYADLVEMLTSHGASLAIEDEAFHATPAGWYSHGRENCMEPGGDYPRVERLLLAAGAKL